MSETLKPVLHEHMIVCVPLTFPVPKRKSRIGIHMTFCTHVRTTAQENQRRDTSCQGGALSRDGRSGPRRERLARRFPMCTWRALALRRSEGNATSRIPMQYLSCAGAQDVGRSITPEVLL